AMQAPSNSHIRKWYFISVEDEQIRKELVGKNGEDLLRTRDLEEDIKKTGITNQVSQTMYRYSIPKQASMILNAGAVLIPVFHQPFPLMHPEKRKHLNYFASIWMSIENLLLSAVEEGIYGVTYIPNYPENLKSILGIPDDHEPACVLAIGYPTKDAIRFHPDNYDMEKIFLLNKWSDKK
ncbi:MAG: nitroreductase family protein, partial [Candidatus Thorarchaeota archaeon]